MLREKYMPVSCDFHDKLESLSTLNRQCHIVYRDEGGAIQNLNGHIVDLYTENHAEFMKLNNGVTLRLDQIESVNGVESRSRRLH
jgi:Rho-binding antiterminator